MSEQTDSESTDDPQPMTEEEADSSTDAPKPQIVSLNEMKYYSPKRQRSRPPIPPEQRVTVRSEYDDGGMIEVTVSEPSLPRQKARESRKRARVLMKVAHRAVKAALG